MEEIVVAALVRGDQVLLGHRDPRRQWYPDVWDLIGGHVEHGETPDQAIRRECSEEIRVTIRDPRPVELDVGDPGLRAQAFIVTRWDGEPINAEPDEHDALRWFRARELVDLRLAHPTYARWLPAVIRAAQHG